MSRHRRIASRLKRGLLSTESIGDQLPNKTLNELQLGILFCDAVDSARVDPQLGLAAAWVARAEARRSGEPALEAQAGYTLTVCLNRMDEWETALAEAAQSRQAFARLRREVDAARCDWEAAYALRYMAEYRRGEHLAARAERVFRRNNCLEWLGKTLVERARNLNQLGQLDEAAQALAEARRIFAAEESRLGLAWCDLTDAARLAQAGQPADALPHIERAWLAFRRLGCVFATAWADFQLGYVASQLREFDRASEALERSARRFKRLGLRFRQALALNQWGVTLLDQGEFGKAGRVLTSAHTLFKQIQPTGMYIGLVRTNLGLINIMRGDLAAAEEFMQSARAVLSRFDSPRWRAAAEAGLGYLCREKGRFDGAIACMEAAGRQWSLARDDYNAAVTVEDLAEVYLLLGDHQKGLSLLQQSLDYYRETNRPVDEARAQTGLAQACVLAGRPAEALPLLDAAGHCAEAGGLAWLGARIERIRGEALAALGQLDAADTHLGLAVALYEKQGLPFEQAAAALVRAELWRQRRLEDARRIMQNGVPPSALSSPEVAWRYHFLRARLAHQRAEAAGEYQAALAILQEARQSLSSEELAGVYFAERRPVFDEAVELAVEMRRPEAALEISEEGRAQTLAGHLQGSAGGAARPPSNISRARDRLRAEIRLRRHRASGRAGLVAGGFSRQPDDERLMGRYVAAAAAVRRESRRGARRAPAWRPFAWQDFMAQAEGLLPAGWTGLVYHQLGQRLLVFKLSAAGVAVQSVDLAAAGNPLAALAGDIRSPLLQRNGAELRRRLYDLLIPPDTTRRLQPDRLLLILPCGPLCAVPFHALQAPDGRYLVEQATVSYAPSLRALSLLAARRAGIPQRQRPDSLCLVANTNGAGPLADLPAARREADYLIETFQSNVLSLCDEQATTAELTRLSQAGKLAEYDYIHLLAHGCFDERTGRRARLSLADGELLVDDVAELRLRARVVTLSACEGGLHEVCPGEEWVGLTQAFLAAGADSVVSGLWPVADKLMPGVMRQFYKNLRAGSGPAAALCAAQRQQLRFNFEPYHWAALAAVGLP